MTVSRPIAMSLMVIVTGLCLGSVGCTRPQTPPQEQSQQGPAQSSPKPAESQQAEEQDDELRMGQEVFDQLKAKGQIVESSPLYDELSRLRMPSRARRSRSTTIRSSSIWCMRSSRTPSLLPGGMSTWWIRCCTL